MFSDLFTCEDKMLSSCVKISYSHSKYSLEFSYNNVVFFVLINSAKFSEQVFNMNFHEVFSVSAEMHSVLCIVFNQVRNELITGGTGGMKVLSVGGGGGGR